MIFRSPCTVEIKAESKLTSDIGVRSLRTFFFIRNNYQMMKVGVLLEIFQTADNDSSGFLDDFLKVGFIKLGVHKFATRLYA